MMEAVRAWLTSVVLVSVLLSAAQSLIPPGTVRKAAGFTGGLILLLVLLRPVLGADLEHLELDFDHYQAAVEERQEELADTQTEAMASIIAEQTEAYILDKAGELGLEAILSLHAARNGRQESCHSMLVILLALVRGADGQLVAGAGVGAGDGTGHPGGEAGLA